MAVSSALRRLLNIRGIQEEQSRLALDAKLGELNRLQHALQASAEQDRSGRLLVQTSARNGELPDRLAGLEETRAAGRRGAVLAPRIADAKRNVAALRQEFIAKRVERRQAETLIQETEARDAVEAGRRGQQGLDDWYGNRLRREQTKLEPSRLATSAPATSEAAPGEPIAWRKKLE
jgi:hypothetical protein